MTGQGARQALLAAFAALLLVLLTACAAEHPQPRPAKFLRAEAVWQGPAPGMLEVRVYEIPPGTRVEAVVLLGPRGERLATRDFQTSTSESGPGVTGGPISLSVGVNAIPRSGILGGRPGVLSQRKLARIALPADSRYLEAPRAWRIEVRHRDLLGEARVLTLPGPLP